MAFGKDQDPNNGKQFGRDKPSPGRRKGSKNRATMIRKILETKWDFENPSTGKPQRGGKVEQAIVWEQVKKALNGDTKAFEVLMDSAYGKPKEHVEATVTNPFVINPEFDISEAEDPE